MNSPKVAVILFLTLTAVCVAVGYLVGTKTNVNLSAGPEADAALVQAQAAATAYVSTIPATATAAAIANNDQEGVSAGTIGDRIKRENASQQALKVGLVIAVPFVLVFGAIIVVYTLGGTSMIMQDKLQRQPIVSRSGDQVVVVTDDGMYFLNDTIPGAMFYLPQGQTTIQSITALPETVARAIAGKTIALVGQATAQAHTRWDPGEVADLFQAAVSANRSLVSMGQATVLTNPEADLIDTS